MPALSDIVGGVSNPDLNQIVHKSGLETPPTRGNPAIFFLS